MDSDSRAVAPIFSGMAQRKPAAPRRIKKPAPRWGVYLFRKKADYLGWVDAPDRVSALAQALEEHKVSSRDRFRLSVVRER